MVISCILQILAKRLIGWLDRIWASEAWTIANLREGLSINSSMLDFDEQRMEDFWSIILFSSRSQSLRRTSGKLTDITFWIDGEDSAREAKLDWPSPMIQAIFVSSNIWELSKTSKVQTCLKNQSPMIYFVFSDVQSWLIPKELNQYLNLKEIDWINLWYSSEESLEIWPRAEYRMWTITTWS